MSRKTAAAVKDQPALFGEAAPAVIKAKTVSKKQAAKMAEAFSAQPKKAQHLAVVKNNPTNTLALIADALKDPNFKPENMRLVLDMHKEMVGEQARLDYIAKMRELKRKLPIINKDGLIEFKDKGQGKAKLRFASFDHIHDVITPLLDEFGFDLWFSSEPGATGMINVLGHLEHENGFCRTTVFPMPHDNSGGKSGAQGWASAFSFGKRVATIGLLNIRTKAPEDRDLDGNKPRVTKSGKPQTIEGDVVVEGGIATVEVCSEDQLVAVRDAIAACGVTDKAFCGHFEIAKVSQLPAARYQDALDACRNYAEKRGQR